MASNDEPVPKKIRVKISLKIVRVKKTRQTHKRIGALMELAA